MRCFFIAVASIVASGLLAPACAKKTVHELDHELVRVTSDARLRTDTIGSEKFAELATFVLVEAENTSKEDAYITLTGELADASGAKVGDLKPQSLWTPAGERRTFALVDRERKARPSAQAASIRVRGARVAPPPPARIDGSRQVPDGDKVVMQGTLVNEASRPGNIMVVATFYGADGRPMTRPFSLLWVDSKGSLPVQFVGPIGSTRGTLFIGDTAY